MIALDTTALSALFIQGASICRKGTTVPIKYAKERLEALIERIANDREPVIVPTPALSELLVMVPPAKIAPLLDQLNSSMWFRIEAFDSASAVELGMRIAKARAAGDKREGLPADTPWAKVKFDRQIVAIAITSGASMIISEDPDVKNIDERWGMKVISVEELDVRDEFIPPPLLAPLEEDATPSAAESATTPTPATNIRRITFDDDGK